LEPPFFALVVVQNEVRVVIIVLRGRRLNLVQRFGWLYLLLAIPATYVIVLVRWEEKSARTRFRSPFHHTCSSPYWCCGGR
jgi:hypothetical protein